MEELNESLHAKLLNFDETRRIEWMNARKTYAVLFELTSGCNFNCVHCYLQNHHVKEMLSLDEIKQILDILYEKGILFITFTGGEILTRKDFADIYLYAKKKGFLVELFTNGYLFNDKIIEMLQEYPPLLVSISIYGGNNDTYQKITGITGAFDKVVENCRKLKQAGVRTALKSPIMVDTMNEMDQMQKMADEIGLQIVFSFDIHEAIDGSDVPKDFQTKLSTALKYEFDDYDSRGNGTPRRDYVAETKAIQNDKHIYTCNVAMNSFVIDYTGNMLPCMKLRHKGINLLNNQFDEIWEQFAVYKEYVASADYVCKKCDSVYFCDVCPAEMDFKYGDMEHRDCSVCKASHIRKAFYCGEVDYDEAIRMADL